MLYSISANESLMLPLCVAHAWSRQLLLEDKRLHVFSCDSVQIQLPWKVSEETKTQEPKQA